tara:strand:+ start:32 stop:898 length:867 start_codon:yes stop_codon:yes gene_type:complete
MIPAGFSYYKANSLKEAFTLSSKYGDEAKYMSGGHSLLPMMKLRFASPKHIIDISKIGGLSYIKEEDDLLKIGALTTQSEIEYSPLIKEKYPIFTDAAKLIADPTVRNVGTIGGNIAHGDAANDQPSLMLAMNATLLIEGPSGKRTLAVSDFFHGFYMTDLEPSEILIEIQVPKAKENSGGAYYKMERKVGDYATTGSAVYLEMDNGICSEVGIGLTNVNAIPLKLERAEELLKGKKINSDLIDQAGTIAAEDCDPESDLRGSEAFKRAATKSITIKMLNKALERANS